MTETFQTLELDPSFDISVVDGEWSISSELAAQVASFWIEQKARLGEHLFDGRVFSAVDLSPTQLNGQWIRYRYAAAAYMHDEIAAQLAITPVAVNGITRCGDGVLLGKRGPHVATYAGYWELAPSGSLDPKALRGGSDTISCKQALLQELTEETGLSEQHVSSVVPKYAVRDYSTRAIELVLDIDLHPKARDALSTDHDEYTEFLWHSRSTPLPSPIVPLTHYLLSTFFRRNRGQER